MGGGERLGDGEEGVKCAEGREMKVFCSMGGTIGERDGGQLRWFRIDGKTRREEGRTKFLRASTKEMERDLVSYFALE